MKRVGLIGCGAIGRPVARALLAGRAGAHSLAAVLARAPRDLDGFPVTNIADRFLAGGHDLIIEVGGPAAFRAFVPAALERCEVWAVSPVPLADPVVEREIRGISASTGHALRIAPGALAAFDGIATAMAGGLESLDVFIDLGAGEASEPELLFEGTAREVGLRFPEGVNVVIAAALAGPGLDATHVRVMRPPRGSAGRTMGFTVRSRAGVFELMARPRVVRGGYPHRRGEPDSDVAPRDGGYRHRLGPAPRTPSERVWTDDFPAVAIAELIAFVVVDRSVVRELLDVAAGCGRGVHEQDAAGFAAGALPSMRDVAREERAGAGATDGDLVTDLEGDLAGEHPGDLVAVAVQMEQALGADGHGFLEQHDALIGLVADELQGGKAAGCHHVEMLPTPRGYDKAFCRVHIDVPPCGVRD